MKRYRSTEPQASEAGDVPRTVAIAGAGPAGLTAAIAAARLGLRGEVVERSHPGAQLGGGVMLNANGLQVIEALGLLPSFQHHLAPIDTVVVRRAHGATLLKLSGRGTGGPNPPSIVMRRTLQDLLEAEAQRLGVVVHWGTVVAGCDTAGGGAALVGEDGGLLVRGDVVIGADGIGSAVRATAGLRHRFRRTEDAFLRVISTTPTGDAAQDVWSSDGRRAGVAPIAEGGSYLYLSVPPGGWDEIRSHRLTAWRRSWFDLGSEVGAGVEGVADWDAVSYDVIKEVRMRRWSKPPIFLVGDAAHAMQPYLGQGTNAAMVDSLILTRLLASEPDLERVAAQYHAIRRRFVHRLQLASRWAGWCGRRHSAPVRHAIDLALLIADRFPPARRYSHRLLAGHNPKEQGHLSMLTPPPEG